MLRRLLLGALLLLAAPAAVAQVHGGGANTSLSNVALPTAITSLGLNVGGALKVTTGGVPSPAAFSDVSGTITATQGGVFTGTANALVTGGGSNTAPNFVALTGLVLGNGASAPTAVTAPAGTIVGTTDTQTLTNKTLTDAINQEAHVVGQGGAGNFTSSTSTGLATIGGLDQTFTTAGYYSCSGYLHFTTAPTSSNGFKVALVTDGTSSVSALAFTATGLTSAGAVATYGTATALGSTAIGATLAMTEVQLQASIKINVGGVIHVQANEIATSGSIAVNDGNGRWDCHRAA